MEPVTIAIICATAFGIAAGIAAFIRQLLLSRDKSLNDEAQHKALTLEAAELEKIRNQMLGVKRFDSHYQLLGANKDAIEYLDDKIEEVLKKKYTLIEQYAMLTLKESTAIIAGESSEERKCLCDTLKAEIDEELAFYQTELQQLQKRRAALWDAHTGMQDRILDQEKLRNDHLDALYEHHSGVLEKVYIRHNENSEAIAKQSIDASTQTFKALLSLPFQAIIDYFKLSSGISVDAVKKEAASRDAVNAMEDQINGTNKSDDDILKNPTNLSALLRKKRSEPAV